MTPEQVDALKPGPDMDALLAEKVMGWSGREGEIWHDAEGKSTGWGTDNCITLNDVTTSQYWRPSTHMDAAMALVEKAIGALDTNCLSEPGFRVEWAGGEWEAGFTYDHTLDCCHRSLDPYECATGDTAAAAACRAVLKAILAK